MKLSSSASSQRFSAFFTTPSTACCLALNLLPVSLTQMQRLLRLLVLSGDTSTTLWLGGG